MNTPASPGAPGRSRSAVRVVWWPGLVVALGAAVATAHGLYEVAVAARVPGGIAWLYPLITDGLALVAYAATARLTAGAARYAWTVVIAAAGLSGLAQAVYLAADAGVAAPPVLRFGVGAWPAIAAAVVAHLLYLLTADTTPTPLDEQTAASGAVPVQLASVQPAAVRPDAVQPEPYELNSTPAPFDPEPAAAPAEGGGPGDGDLEAQAERPFGPGASLVGRPASDRAHLAALRLARRTGTWPTVSALEAEAGVGRGTAAAVLKNLRDQPPGLHLITIHPTTEHHQDPEQDPNQSPDDEQETQP